MPILNFLAIPFVSERLLREPRRIYGWFQSFILGLHVIPGEWLSQTSLQNMALFSPGLSRPRDYMSLYPSLLYLLSKPQVNRIPLDIIPLIFLNAYCSGYLLRTPVSPFSISPCQKDRAHGPQQQLPCLASYGSLSAGLQGATGCNHSSAKDPRSSQVAILSRLE